MISLMLPALSHAQRPDLGVDASLHGKQIFPAASPWNKDVSAMPVDPRSDSLIASIGLSTPLHPDFGTRYNGAPIGFSYVVVPGTQPRIPISFQLTSESDQGPYPVPQNAPVEGGIQAAGDRHVLVIDRDDWQLYEMDAAYPLGAGQRTSSWKAYSGARFDLASGAERPACWTSADAAGLPIFPGLVRYDEVWERGTITHALRFTVVHSRRAYVAPARHFASRSADPSLPPMGMRVRLKASVNTSDFPHEAQVVLAALKKYGMFVADNGSNLYLSGANDSRWNDDALRALQRVHGSDFEVVKMDNVVTSCP